MNQNCERLEATVKCTQSRNNFIIHHITKILIAEIQCCALSVVIHFKNTQKTAKLSLHAVKVYKQAKHFRKNALKNKAVIAMKIT